MARIRGAHDRAATHAAIQLVAAAESIQAGAVPRKHPPRAMHAVAAAVAAAEAAAVVAAEAAAAAGSRRP